MADEWCPFASQSLFDRNIADETVRRKRNKRDVLHSRVCEAHALVIESIREQCCPSDFFRSSRPAAGTREWTNSSSMLAHVCVYAGVLRACFTQTQCLPIVASPICGSSSFQLLRRFIRTKFYGPGSGDRCWRLFWRWSCFSLQFRRCEESVEASLLAIVRLPKPSVNNQRVF